VRFNFKRKDPKVEVFLAGGLGNQLFQYFAGLYVARELDRDLILLGQNIDHNHTFGLFNIDSFGIEASVKSSQQLINPIVIHVYSALKIRLVSVLIHFLKLNKKESKDSFEETSKLIEYYKNRTSDRIQLRGYFQDFLFFKSLKGENTLLHLVNPSERFRFLLQECHEVRPIAFHVRLGDFVEGNNPQTIGSLSTDYYLSALSVLKNRGITGPIWVFSNDKQGAINLFEGKLLDAKVKFIGSNFDLDPAEDLLIMSKCKALVVANSTYSFWAGNLGGLEMQVIYPEQFTRANIYKISGIPNHWTSMPSIWS
jgi:hypothetical protein